MATYFTNLSSAQIEFVTSSYKENTTPHYLYTYEFGPTSVKRTMAPMHELPFAIPPDLRLDALIEYNGPGHIIGVWWERSGDEVAVTDGYITSVGGNPWWNFLSFLRAFPIGNLSIGSSDDDAINILVFDRISNKWYYGAKEDMLKVIEGQWREGGFPHGDERITKEMRQAINKLFPGMFKEEGDGNEQ
jgi:hypothetical protein